MESAPQQKESLFDRALVEFARRGVKLYIALFLVEVALFFVVVVLPFFPGEQAFYTSQSNQLGNELNGVTWFGLFWEIFANNFRIALLETIPGFGPVLFTVSLYETARVLQVTAINDGTPAVLVVFLLLLLFPHSWIELPSYAVATGESLYLVYGLVRAVREGRRPGPNFDEITGERKRMTVGDRIVTGIRQYLLVVFVIFLMLWVAALFESTEIELGATYFWLTWIPFAALIAFTIIAYRRIQTMKKEEQAPEPVYPMVIS